VGRKCSAVIVRTAGGFEIQLPTEIAEALNIKKGDSVIFMVVNKKTGKMTVEKAKEPRIST
jgi:bifunctional DNA-binding transcriptional regulator/antitoxin component of YhaV-PrlF toxin-antitoxin module